MVRREKVGVQMDILYCPSCQYPMSFKQDTRRGNLHECENEHQEFSKRRYPVFIFYDDKGQEIADVRIG